MPVLEQRLRSVIDDNAPAIDIGAIVAGIGSPVVPLEEGDERAARGIHRPRAVLWAAVVLVVVIGAIAWLAWPETSAPKVHPSDEPAVRIAPPVVQDGWDPRVPRSVAAPHDPKLDFLGERIAVEGPDGNWAGYVDRSVAQAVPNFAATPGDPERATAAFFHEFVPVTRTADPDSDLVGFLLRGYGVIPLQTIQAPGFDLDALVAQADARR